MTNLMKIETNLTMTSLEIAELVESRHDDVKRSIDRLVQKGVIIQPPMADEQTPDALGRVRSTQVYIFSGEKGRRDSIVVVAQLCPEFTARLVDRWQELEAKELQPVFKIPQTYAQALTLAAAQAVEIEEKDKQLALAAPKVDFVDQYVDTTGKTTFRQLAKILQVNERRLRHFLKDNKIMYQLNDEWVGYSKYMKNGMLETVTGFNKDMCRSFTTTVFTPKGVNHVASYWKK